MRKLTFGNRSDSGASNEAVLMSVVETGVLNDVEPLDIFRALSIKTLTSFGELPEPKLPPFLKTGLGPLRFLGKRRAARFSNQTHTRATERTFLENLPVTSFWYKMELGRFELPTSSMPLRHSPS